MSAAVEVFETPGARRRGAMFAQALGERVLVFRWPRASRRLFHSFFCPPLRVLALGENGEIVFDRVVLPGRLVRLPPCRLVLECDPGRMIDPQAIASAAQERSASWTG